MRPPLNATPRSRGLCVMLTWSMILISGCLPLRPMVSPTTCAIHADHIANRVSWQARTIETTLFSLKSYGSSPPHKTKILTIYIEGDGLAWLSEDRPSDNPTPIVPTGLKMAIHDRKHHPIAYLARPCQFVFKEAWRNCRQEYWTHLRFSPEVVDAMNQAVGALKKSYHAQHIILIGYSGGGTIATLLAARRTDVIQLITVAAILDTDYWVKQEHLTPLYGSLNPADAWKNLVSTPQMHWVGGKDTVVRQDVAFAFAKRFPVSRKPKIIVIPTFDHTCCWVSEWDPYSTFAFKA